MGTDQGWKPIGYLFGIGFTRDAWMHRVDLARANGRPMTVTAEHDGRIVAEWATLHTDPFSLDLAGPAGGTYRRRTSGEVVETDAVEFCRTLCGRGPRPTDRVLRHALPL